MSENSISGQSQVDGPSELPANDNSVAPPPISPPAPPIAPPSLSPPGTPPPVAPWLRRRGEPPKAYAKLKVYLELGPDRSYSAVAGRFGLLGYRPMSRLSAKWDWLARAHAYDNHMAEIEQARREKVAAEYAEKWERRRRDAAEENWDLGVKLKARCEEMLAAPLYREEVVMTDAETGRPLTVIMEPVGWSLGTLGTLAKVMAELRAAALAEALGGVDDAFDVENATPEQCREYLERQGVKGQLEGPTAGK